MPELFLELFSEEIPARMQPAAARILARLIEESLAPIAPRDIVTYYGPRRIAATATVAAEEPAADIEFRGPKVGAPPQALEGFLRKNQARREELVEDGGHVLLRRRQAARPAASLVVEEFANALANFAWPKSMRWGQGGDFSWVRPLRRIVCLLDGAVVPIVLGPVTASDETEGHRFMAPGSFQVTGAAQWEVELERRFVIAGAEKRRAMIEDGLRDAAAMHHLSIVKDDGLLDEVTGLVEWPVALIGKIEPHQMALPPEVRELSMKVNQRYFSTRDEHGHPAPFFAFVANIEADDGGAAIIAGNERVLRARLADAEHFWAQDRKQKLADYLPKLEGVVFHAKLGTQFDRAQRIAKLAHEIAETLGVDAAEVDRAEAAGRLCKADLVTGMVGEFPELQGIMGGYYADDAAIGAAIRTHYQPKGPSDEVPHGALPCAVALADKIDTLREFFRIGEMPTGSGDPYALRRAALGVIRIILEKDLRLPLKPLLQSEGLFDFIIERLRVKLRGEGKRFDVVNAILGAAPDDDLIRIQQRADALEAFIRTDDGANLLTAYRRGANILRIENAKDGPHEGDIDASLANEIVEIELIRALDIAQRQIEYEPEKRGFTVLLEDLATLRLPVDQFFETLIVNIDKPELRKNRLRILARLRDVMHRVADFSKLEG